MNNRHEPLNFLKQFLGEDSCKIRYKEVRDADGVTCSDSSDNQTKACIRQVFERALNDNNWNTYRWLNGDETWYNSFLFTTVRSYTITTDDEKVSVIQALAPIPVLNQSLEKSLQVEQIKAPGIYKVKLYQQNW